MMLELENEKPTNFFSLLSLGMEDLIHLVDALAFRHLDVRLAKWICGHANQSNIILTTHQVIAKDLASSREVISRLLKEFEREKIIKLSRGEIKIINQDKIRLINN